ncbi:MAG: hypothetical protein QM666_01440 [Acinetobacter sp.]
MLSYILPFVVLLIIALILKQRQSTQHTQASKSAHFGRLKKTKQRTNIKIATRTTQATVASHQPKTSDINPLFKKQIESLIYEKNYPLAEALLNETLYKHPSQHELYLYLLDIHLAKDDQLAIQLLFSHLKALQLHTIIPVAERHIRKTAPYHVPIQYTAPDALPEHLPAESPIQETQVSQLSSEDDTSPQAISQNFENHENKIRIVQQHLSSTPPKTQDSVEELNNLMDVQFSLEPHSIETKGAGYDSLSIKNHSPELATFHAKKSRSSTLHMQAVTDNHSIAFEQVQSSSHTDMQQDALLKTFENLNFESTLSLSSNNDVPISPLSSIMGDHHHHVTNTTDTSGIESNDPHDYSMFSIQQDDALLQQFPHLQSLNQAELILNLAQHYVTLGVFEAAETLLKYPSIQFDAHQTERAKNILKQIAS